MSQQQEYVEQVAQFVSGLEKVVELGYGEDECEQGILVMFEHVVRQAIPSDELHILPFKLPLRIPAEKNTYDHLLRLASFVQNCLERKAVSESGLRGTPVVFPFLTALATSGGLFLLAVHISRMAPIVL